jgi:hypothetical protein
MPVSHDTFEWIAYIWLPALIGVATLAVSGVALWVSHRATVLAGKVEMQREAAADERAEDDRRRRLQEMAIDDARALRRYAVEAVRPSLGHVSHSIGSAPPPRLPRVQAEIDARIQLEQSLVRGAGTLFELTQFDVDHRDAFLPEAIGFKVPGHEERADLREALRRARDHRMFDRIRQWGLDPERTAPLIDAELTLARTDPQNYLKIGPR